MRRFWTLGYLAGTNSCSIWSNARDTVTVTTTVCLTWANVELWWDVWDLAKHTILDAEVLDRNVTWLTKHKDTS